MTNFKLTGFLIVAFCLTQCGSSEVNSSVISYDKVDKELADIYSKIFPFYHGDQDSLSYYSDLFASRLTDFIQANPTTIDYKFKSLAENNSCRIETTTDGLFRIYSWDTWQGGTMHHYKNLYQFRSEGRAYTTYSDYEEGDMGTFFTGVYSLPTKGQNFFLAISMGSESTRYYYETISAYEISNNTLNDTVKLFKTPNGMNNSILVEYDAATVLNRPERPIRLIRYDTAKKIIFIPIVLDGGKVTDRYTLYQFNGQYFKKDTTLK